MIKFKRQDGGNSSSSPAKKPGSLAYGEPAVSSDGTFYAGDGAGNVKSLVENSKRSFRANNGQWEFYGTYKAASWTSISGGYSQTASVTCANASSITITSSARLGGPMTSQTNNFTTNEKKLEALGIINMGQCIPGSGTVTIKCKEKPTMDIDVHWYVNMDEDHSEEEYKTELVAQTMKLDVQSDIYKVPVGYIFDWSPVEGNDIDLSSPGKVTEYFGYGTWIDLNNALETDGQDTFKWKRIA